MVYLPTLQSRVEVADDIYGPTNCLNCLHDGLKKNCINLETIVKKSTYMYERYKLWKKKNKATIIYFTVIMIALSFVIELTLDTHTYLSALLAHLSFWDTAMSVVRVDVRDVSDVHPSTFKLVYTLEGTVLIQSS